MSTLFNMHKDESIEDRFLSFFTSNLNIKLSMGDISYILIISGIIIMLAYYLYSFDIKRSKEYIFLRISKFKWLTGIYISIFIINFIINMIFLIVYICLELIYKNNIDIGNIIYYFGIILIVRLCIMYLSISICSLFSNIGIILFYLAYLIPIFIKYKILTVFNFLYASSYTDYLIAIPVGLAVILITFYINMKCIDIFFERSN